MQWVLTRNSAPSLLTIILVRRTYVIPSRWMTKLNLKSMLVKNVILALIEGTIHYNKLEVSTRESSEVKNNYYS